MKRKRIDACFISKNWKEDEKADRQVANGRTEDNEYEIEAETDSGTNVGYGKMIAELPSTSRD